MALEIKNIVEWLKQWFYDSDEVDSLLANKQATLVAGSNIKTINNTSLLGSGNISISGGGGSFEPELVYSCSSFNSTYINTSATNRLELYKLGSIYFLRYFISTNSLTYSTNDYNINSDSISSEYRPSSNVTFHVSTSSNHNAKITITSAGKVTISTDANSTAVSLSGSVTYWWADAPVTAVALSLSSASVSYGSSVTLSATVTQGGSAVSGETVTFYDGSTSLGTATTNSSGVATLTKSDWSVSTHSLTAVYGSVTSSAETLTVSKATPTISLTASSATPTYGTSINLVGSLSSLGSGASVKIYDGNTLLDTVTTGTGGAFTCSTSSLTVGSHSLTAVFEGNSNYNSVTSSAVSVNVSKITSTISLSASSASVAYGSSVTLSGTLSVGSGKSVKLYDGNTLVGTLTTGTNGAFSYTSSSISIGSHSYTAVYEGDSTHTNVTSSAVSVTITKITSTISLSAVSSTIAVGDSPQLTGTLSVGSGKTVYITDGDIVLDSVTTGTNGAFSYTGSATSTAGTLTFQAVYDGDSTHTDAESSVVSITVQAAPSYDAIELTSDKSIISYADGESATLTAQLKNNGSAVAVSGVTLSFVIKKGTTTIDTKTATTGSDGSCSVSYVGQGTGDLNIQVSDGSILSITYELLDAKFHDDGSSDKTSSYSNVLHSYGSFSHNTNEYVLVGKTRQGWIGVSPMSISSSDNFQFEVEMKGENGRFIGIGIGKTTSTNSYYISNNIGQDNMRVYDYRSGGGYLTTDQSITNTSTYWHKFVWKIENNTCTVQTLDIDGNVLASSTFSLPTTYRNTSIYPIIECYGYDNQYGTTHFKNFKIKAL